MTVMSGCHEGKATPKLQEVTCPECGAELEVFVRIGGAPENVGTLASDEECDKCGHVIKEGTRASDLL